MPHTADSVAAVLRPWRYRMAKEEQLRDGIAEVLAREQIPFLREHVLSAGDRIDFLVDGHIGLEAKLHTSRTEMIRQLHRYAKHAVIDELLLVTVDFVLDASMPRVYNGKPLVVALLKRSVF